MLRLLPIATLAALVGGCGHHQPVVRLHRRRPNVVFVLTDDLSTDLLTYLPAVRRMERDGATFSRYVVSDSLCCPSRASIFTGMLPHDTGVFFNTRPNGGLYAYGHHRDGRVAFAPMLRRRGYRTALFGKYLNGYAAGHQGPAPGWSDWAATAEGYANFNYLLNVDGRPRFYGADPQDYLTDVIAHRGEHFIDRAARADAPFLLELASFAPHKPSVPAPRDAHALPFVRAPRDAAFDRRGSGEPDWLADRPPLSRRRIHQIDRRYRQRARSVLAVNAMIDGIERELRRTGQARDTYLVFSSDNGFHMGQHRLLPGKLTAFDTDVRVPLVVVGPGVRADTRIGALASNTDLAPTFEALAHARVPPGTDGRSLVPLLHGRVPANWRRAALVEHHHPPDTALDPDRQGRLSGDPPTYEALRTRRHTYVEYTRHADRSELYDDRRDPAQLRNRYRRLSPAARRRWHRRLVRLSRCHGASQCATSPSRPVR